MAKKVMLNDEEGMIESPEIVDAVVKKAKVVDFHIDSEPKDVIKYIKQGGAVFFDPDDLPILEQSDLAELPYRVVQEYLKAKAQRDSSKKSPGGIEYVGMLGNTALRRLKIRPRRGYHQAWKRPDQLDDAKEMGYVMVRKPGKEGEKAGAESGELLKLGPRDNPELLAMEIPEHLRKRYVEAVAQKSRGAYAANKEGFVRAVEEVNVRVPRGDKAVIVDDERDVG